MSESPAPGSPAGARVLLAADAEPREFLGIPFDLLATGDRLMVTRMRYETGMTVAAHAHEHEQAGYVISGRYRQTAAGAVNELGPGDSYVIAGGIEHAMEVLEGGHVIDVFTPPREGYR
jgi:unsaturated pyranuronate lyase